MDQIAQILINLGRIGLEQEHVKEIDINPVVLDGSKPVAVDALVVLRGCSRRTNDDGITGCSWKKRSNLNNNGGAYVNRRYGNQQCTTYS